MWRICWPWSAWLDVIDFLRETSIDYCHQHAGLIPSRLDETPADVAEPCVSLPDDVVLRSVNLARWKLGLRLPDRAL
jgi:hypothetical protein